MTTETVAERRRCLLAPSGVPTMPASEATELAGVAILLRRVSRVVDRMLKVALVEPSGERALQLGEASHAIHQALLAVDACPSGQR